MHTDRFCRPNGSPSPNLAIFVMRTADGAHTGILHRMNGEVIIQDMLWHEMFRNQPSKDMPHYVVLEFEEEVENDVRGMCRLIHNRHNSRDPSKKYRIPYSFRHGNNNRFCRETGGAPGELVLADGLGLTSIKMGRVGSRPNKCLKA
jgi:hypothetical protein